MRWPILTIVGVTAAVIVGIVHASLNAAMDCLLGEDELGHPYTTWADGFGPDGYGQ
jgi:hypothetical protein